MMTCSGRTAIVTGAAGKGMGRSVALTLAREGAEVVVNYLNSRKSAEDIVGHIERDGGRALAFQADVMEKDSCKRLFDATVERFGKVDICIIGPGGGWHPEKIDSLDSEAALDDARRELAPVYHFMPLVLPEMSKRKWGRLIAISLTEDYSAPAYAYNAAKAARTHALMIARDSAWAKGVTVNVIGPGYVPEIGSLDLAIEQCEHGEAWKERSDTSPQDIAESVAFLCSDSGDFISGGVIPFMNR